MTSAALSPVSITPQIEPANFLNLLIVDDERSIREACREVAQSLGFSVADSAEHAYRFLDTQPFDAVLLDLRLPGAGGLDALRRIKERRPEAVVIVVTGYGTVQSAVQAMKNGAYDYVTKPFSLDELKMLLERVASHLKLKSENRMLREKVKSKQGFGGIVGVLQKWKSSIASLHHFHPELIPDERCWQPCGCTLNDPPSSCVYSSTGLIAGIANSSYNALETSLRKRFSHGISFLASYTFSKTIDDASSFNMTGSASKPVAGENDLAQNPFNLAAERGRSLFDSRHRFVLSYQWSLPLWRQPHGLYQQVLGAWQVNGIATIMSGTPFTVFDSNDVSEQGGAPEITGFSANRPNLVSGQDPNSGPRTPHAWLNANAFQRLTPNPNSPVQQFGTAGRNIAQGPGYTDWDFSAFKNIRVTEGKEFQFRAEFFNFLNHTNFRLPDSDISSPTFNQILTALPPRQIQLALKFMF